MIAVPVYYATGSRWRGLAWAAGSGLAEPLGGLLGLAALRGGGSSPAGFGAVLGLVAGTMVSVALGRLLPAALRHDPGGRVAKVSAWAGMAVMAASLVLFDV